jgi:hypothetical protein
MTVSQLLAVNNVYRAIGKECWHSGTSQSRDGKTITVKPSVYKVRIEGRADGGVWVVSKTGNRKFSASPENLHDSRPAAHAKALSLCQSLHGQTVMGQLTYHYDPKPQPRVLCEYRARPFTARSWSIEYREGGKGQWKRIEGLFNLSPWKAKDAIRRLRANDDIPGFWRVPGQIAFIELCIYID